MWGQERRTPPGNRSGLSYDTAIDITTDFREENNHGNYQRYCNKLHSLKFQTLNEVLVTVLSNLAQPFTELVMQSINNFHLVYSSKDSFQNCLQNLLKYQSKNC